MSTMEKNINDSYMHILPVSSVSQEYKNKEAICTFPQGDHHPVWEVQKQIDSILDVIN